VQYRHPSQAGVSPRLTSEPHRFISVGRPIDIR